LGKDRDNIVIGVKLKLGLSPVQWRLQFLREQGIKAQIDIIDNHAKWDISEAVWIDRLRAQGMKLLNVASVVK
jgi:hypothetical protein